MNFKAYLENPFRIFYHFNYLKISHLLSDKMLIKLLFRARMGYKMDFKNPKSFNQKIQWLKIYYREPIFTTIVDKYEVREYIANRLGTDYLIPLLGVYDSFDEIDFSLLPNRFVMKCTHDCGSVIVCRNKEDFDKNKAEKAITEALKKNFYYQGREWPYKNVKPQIIIEEFMEEESGSDEQIQGLTDYKFYCFNGKVKFLYVSKGLEDHDIARISFLKPDWTFEDFFRSDYQPFDYLPKKPKNYAKMCEIAELLSKDYPFLRVDLYEINDRIYFSELTLSPSNGFMPFVPIEKDFEVGKLLVLPR